MTRPERTSSRARSSWRTAPPSPREYGIPAVICVRNATHEIETGQLITVDGTAGTVRVDEDG